MFTSIKAIKAGGPLPARLGVLVAALNRRVPLGNKQSWSDSEILFPTAFVIDSNGRDDFEWVVDNAEIKYPEGYTTDKRRRLQGHYSKLIAGEDGFTDESVFLVDLQNDLKEKGIQCLFFPDTINGSTTAQAVDPVPAGQAEDPFSKPNAPTKKVAKAAEAKPAKSIPQVLGEIKALVKSHPAFTIEPQAKGQRALVISWVPKK